MTRAHWALAAALGLAAAGCGGSTAPTAPDPGGRITWEQFQKMPPEEQADPYVLGNLDDAARKKLAEAGKKKGR